MLLENFGGILTSDKENKLFQITEQKTICQNITVYYTSEGFYLTTDQKSLTLTKNEAEIKIIDGLMLTEMDS